MKTQLFLTSVSEKYGAYAKAAAKRWLEVLPELSGVTIANETAAAQLGLGHLSAKDQACMLKLYAFDLVPKDCDSVLYSDTDVYPFAPLTPEVALHGVDFACVRDRWDDAHVNAISDNSGIPRHQYLNAGLFYMRRSCAPMLRGARVFVNKLPYVDQTALNVSRLAQRTRTAWLAARYNAMDRHADISLGNTHNPWQAWAAWEGAETPITQALPSIDYVISQLDFSHIFTTDAKHLRELAELAKKCRHVLEIGTFQGHAAWAMASTGALITTLDPGNQSGRQYRYGLTIDAFSMRSDEWFAADVDGTYDMIFHDAEHGVHVIPELERTWKYVLPGGYLAIHDAEQLEGWLGGTLNPAPILVSNSADSRGRQLLVLEKLL